MAYLEEFIRIKTYARKESRVPGLVMNAFCFKSLFKTFAKEACLILLGKNNNNNKKKHANIINKLFLWPYVTINKNGIPSDQHYPPPPTANSYDFLKFIFYEQNLPIDVSLWNTSTRIKCTH